MSEVYELPLYKKLTECERYVFEERAGIREFDGLEERWAAESGAIRDILLLRQENGD